MHCLDMVAMYFWCSCMYHLDGLKRGRSEHSKNEWVSSIGCAIVHISLTIEVSGLAEKLSSLEVFGFARKTSVPLCPGRCGRIFSGQKKHSAFLPRNSTERAGSRPLRDRKSVV